MTELMTKELASQMPPLDAQDGKGDDAVVYAHYFIGGFDWYAAEFDGEDTFFGLVSLHEVELGYFSLAELSGIKTPLGGIERDLYWEPKTLDECRRILKAKGKT